ncbi:MAG: M28 family peptidase [Deltaproteobacteria bacterium]|nr:MAG: M28 family peptidase [Deltaproteobacteria bacterium]
MVSKSRRPLGSFAVEIRVDPQQLRRNLQAIVGERSPFSGQRHLAEVESFIEKELASYSLAVESDTFSYRGKNFRNIVGRLSAQRGASLIILGAHFDSVEGTPGADDNASGLAVLLEAARLLSRARLRSELLFCAFNLEELNMIGSTYFAKKLKAAEVKVDAMISLEMIGYTDPRPGSQKYPIGLSWLYPDRGDFIGVIGNWNSSSLLRRFTRQMRQVPGLPVETLSVPGNGGLVPAVRLSDHSPFWDLGYPALMVTDTSFFRNPHYHGPRDTLDTLNLDFMAKVCAGVIRGVLGL